MNDTPQIKFFGTTFLSRKVVRFYSFQLYHLHPHRSVALDPAPEAEGVVPVSMALAGEAGVDLEYAAASQMSIRFMVVPPRSFAHNTGQGAKRLRGQRGTGALSPVCPLLILNSEE